MAPPGAHAAAADPAAPADTRASDAAITVTDTLRNMTIADDKPSADFFTPGEMGGCVAPYVRTALNVPLCERATEGVDLIFSS